MNPLLNKYLAEATKLGDQLLTFAKEDIEDLIPNPIIRIGVNFGINAALSFLHAQEVAANTAAAAQVHAGIAPLAAVAAHVDAGAAPAS